MEQRPAADVVRVELEGELLAESRTCIQLIEGGHPPRYYFPRADLKLQYLTRSHTTTECPFKGTANYFNICIGDHVLPDAVWTYESPFDEYLGIKDHVAFYTERFLQLTLTAGE